MPSGLTFHRLAVVLLFAGIATAACLMPAQSDTFWQLRAGQEMVATGRILLEDTFTHTVAGSYWPNHEWLSHVAFYLLHARGGMPLLTAFAAAVILAWTFAWQTMRGEVAVRFALVALLLAPSARLWSVRPQVLSLAFLGATLWLLARRRFAWLPVLFVVWANFHGGVMLGIGAVGGALALLVLRERATWRTAALTLAGCLVAASLTPLGLAIWTEVTGMLSRLAAYDVQEWRRASLTDPVNLPFWLAGAALVALTVVRRRTLDAQGALAVGAALALLPLAVKSTRNIPPFLLAAAPALTWLVSDRLAEWRLRTRRERRALNATIAALVVMICAAIVSRAWSGPSPRLNWTPVPPGVVEAVSSCPRNLYNQYDNGGYLEWFVPEVPVFMDSRQDPFPVDLVGRHIEAERSGNYDELFRTHEIRCAALPPQSAVARRLVADGWRVRFADGRWMVVAAE